MKALSDTYPTRFRDLTDKQREELFTEWMIFFSDVEDSVFIEAIKRAIKVGKFFPRFPEMEEHIRIILKSRMLKEIDEMHHREDLERWAHMDADDKEILIWMLSQFGTQGDRQKARADVEERIQKSRQELAAGGLING